MQLKKLTSFTLLIIYFFTSSFLPAAPNTETIITVVEGEVFCFDLPEDFSDIEKNERLRTGKFYERIDTDTAWAIIDQEKTLCFLPPKYRGQISDLLYPGAVILTYQNPRAEKKTDWDIISVGTKVHQGQAFSNGTASQEKEKTTPYIPEISTLSAAEEREAAYEAEQDTSNQDETTVEEGEGEDTPPSPPPTPPSPPPEPAPDPTPTPTPTSEFYWVDPVNGSDGNEGSSGAPWRTITYALANANASVNTTINLRAGTYGTTVAGFNGETFPLTMRDGFTLDGDGDNAAAIILDWTGNITNSGIIACTGITAVIRDLTTRNGTGQGTNSGGITIQNSTVTIGNCVINNCSAEVGGGLFCNNSAVEIERCIISNNSASNPSSPGDPGGGGILFSASANTHTLTIRSSDITNNQAITGDGGGILTIDGTVTIEQSLLANNTAATDGGGLCWQSGSLSIGTISMRETTFTGNNAQSGNGGAIDLTNQTSSTDQNLFARLDIYNNTVSSSGKGAGIHIATGPANPTYAIGDCRFVNNTGPSNNNGGGIHWNGGECTIEFCTFAVNSPEGIGIEGLGTSNNHIRNNIIYNNTRYGIYSTAGSDPEVDANAIYGNSGGIAYFASVGTGTNYADTNASMAAFNSTFGIVQANVWVNPTTSGYPGFKEPVAQNYRLINVAATANIIDSALTGVFPPPGVDLDGNARPFGGGYDIGCYEYQGVDPPVTGTVYDSITGKTVPSPTVAIFNSSTNTQVALTESNPYTFNVDPGSYYLAISKDGYAFPSQIISTQVSGDHGDIFTVTSAKTINVPLDPDGWLYVEKKCNKERVEIGDIVTYHLTVRNEHWYKAIENVQLVDELVNGFKFISNSGIGGQPTSTNNRQAIFDLGTIAANSTLTRSYQVRVGTGIPPGRYKAACNTRKSTTLARNSNIDSTEIEVRENPLFARGTIIGKVFWDENQNTVQDKDEPGIPDVRIYTEYGVFVQTDQDGKYHLADVPPGNHLLKIDAAGMASAIKFTTDNPYYVKVTEGLLAKVNFGVTLTETKTIETKDQKPKIKDFLAKFFIVALGEGEIRNLSTSGNIDMVEKDDRYDKGVKVDGRLALYLKGKVLGKYLITASIDSERRRGGRYQTKDLFTNLDPDKYYPVYGDASIVDYSASDSQDIAYVLIEWDASFAKWGNFNTGFNLYNRTLSGGQINYISEKKTKFGDPYTIIKGFGAFSRQQPAHDEFVGTGGSLYYLRHRDVIEGSEKIRVEIRDRLSKTTIHTIYLKEEIDYEIDYDSGRVILKKPLNSVQQTYAGSIISNDLLMGERVYLVVDYEYYGGGMSNESYGARLSQQLGPYFRVGGTYVEEQKPGDNYSLAGGDATVKLNMDTHVTARYTHSANTQLDSGMSYDGGITFSEQGSGYSEGKSGSAVSIDGQTKLFNNTDVYLAYNREDPFYSVTNSISSQGSQKYIAKAISRLTENLSAGLSHVTQRYFKHTIAGNTLGARDIHTTTGTLNYQRGKWDLRAEYQHQVAKKPVTDFTYFGTIPLVSNDFIAARIGYQLFNWLHPYVRGQGTLSGRTDNQGTVGADIRLWKNTIINLAETVGNLGNSTLLGVSSSINKDTDVYANLEVGNNLRLGKYTKTTYGQTTILGLNENIYVEEDYSSYQENIVRGNVLGYKKKISNTLALGLTYERSNVKNISRVIDRDAGSIALTYLNLDFMEGLKAYTKLECRNDRGPSEVRQWFTENDILWRLTQSLSLTGRGNWGWTENRTRKIDEAEFYEVGAGFSFRPVTWDKLNILGKYSYLTDLPPDVQWDFPEETKSRKHVYAIESIYDLCRYIQLVGKYVYRDLREKVGLRSDWAESKTHLYLGRTNFHIMQNNSDKPFLLRGWDLGIEYRVLANTDIKDKKKGFLVDISKNIGQYLLLGVGYNFTDYSDDLRNDDYDAKGWFVKINGKY